MEGGGVVTSERARADYAAAASDLEARLGVGELTAEGFMLAMRDLDSEFCLRAREAARDVYFEGDEL